MHFRVALAVVVGGSLLLGLPAYAAGKKKEKAGHPAAAAKADGPAARITSVPPPSGQWEVTPAPAEGYIWSAGYYDWKGDHYAWKPGEWVLIKPGMEYRQHRWVQRSDGKWTLTGGDWVSAGSAHAAK